MPPLQRQRRAGRPAPLAAWPQTLPRSGLISVLVPCTAPQSGAGGSPGHIDAGSRASRQHIGSLGNFHAVAVYEDLDEVICGRGLGRGRQPSQLPPLQPPQLPEALQRRHGVHGCRRRWVERMGGCRQPSWEATARRHAGAAARHPPALIILLASWGKPGSCKASTLHLQAGLLGKAAAPAQPASNNCSQQAYLHQTAANSCPKLGLQACRRWGC